MNILITGCAGFIGFHLCEHILNNTKYKIEKMIDLVCLDMSFIYCMRLLQRF